MEVGSPPHRSGLYYISRSLRILPSFVCLITRFLMRNNTTGHAIVFPSEIKFRLGAVRSGRARLKRGGGRARDKFDRSWCNCGSPSIGRQAGTCTHEGRVHGTFSGGGIFSLWWRSLYRDNAGDVKSTLIKSAFARDFTPSFPLDFRALVTRTGHRGQGVALAAIPIEV